MHFQKPPRGFRGTNDRRARLERPECRRCAGQRPSRQLFCERRQSKRQGYARVNFRCARTRARSVLCRIGTRGGHLERMKAISRGATAADAESYRPELLGDEEPRYLRRQKPVEIRRKKFSGRSWPFYRRVLFYGVVGIAGVSAAVVAGRFLLYAPQMLLVKAEQIEVTGNHIVSREAVLQQFVHDR